MHTRWKALAAACAAAMAFSGEQRDGAHARGARRRPADGSVGRELLVLQELPDGPEPVQRRQHARHQLGHRLLGRPGLRRRLRRVPHLRRLQARAEARLGHPLLRAAGRPVGVRPQRRRQGRHARAVRRQRADRPELRRRAAGKVRDGDVPGERVGGPARLRHLRPDGADSRSRPSTRTAARTPTRCCPRPTASRCTCSTRATRSATARRAARPASRRAARSTTASCRSSTCRSTTRRTRPSSTELAGRLPG